jgi:hypothetical protein
MNVKLRTASTGKKLHRRDSTTQPRRLYTHRSVILFSILGENYCNARELDENPDVVDLPGFRACDRREKAWLRGVSVPDQVIL